MKKKLISAALIMSMTAALLAGCGGGDAGAAASEGGAGSVYSELYDSEVATLNYLTTSTANEMLIPANTIDNLIETDTRGNLVGDLAESWEQSDDGLTWTFHLRDGVKWVDHTGKEVADLTAADFVSAMQYELTPSHEASNVQNLFGVIKSAQEYYMGLTGEPDEDGKVWDEIDFSEVGVKAVDDHTLQYELATEVPYFLSSLVYLVYMPAYGPLLEEQGDNFATSAETMYYCGAYYLSDFVPQEHQILTKNPLYWDAENVHITEINRTYNSEAGTLAPEMVKRGEIDYADIGSDILDDWLNGADTKDLVAKERPTTDYSYFYCMNFNPNFDEEYEPENWKLAVNNECFRQSLKAALNRVNPLAINEPNTPEDYVMNTITPYNFTMNASGVDYTNLDIFADIKGNDSFDEEKALHFKELAMEQLKEAGATFPVKILMKYNPSTTNWDKECAVVEQQMEGVLGTDYIDIIVEAGPSDSFLSEVRRVGGYALMKCNWGADYADPETWTDPFYQAPGDAEGYKYAFLGSAEGETADVVQTYFSLVEDAKKITAEADKDARYNAFAGAESFLIDHALVIPYSIELSRYIAIKYNAFEGEYASCGLIPNYRFKYVNMQDHFVSMDEYDAAREAWEK
ncbi:MAG: peptide ABC transporter substrate-binding protein [Lachnospiraceae bacterium]|nr:peptide ABC transporter substrate-binding protein [Lachnospiraceae bacterium]